MKNPLQMSSDELGTLIERGFIRTLRIAGGLALLVGAFILFHWAYDLLKTPFAQTDLLNILGGLAIGWGGITVLGWAFAAAFGPK